MARVFILLITVTLFASCRSTKKIQTAITKKDTVMDTNRPADLKKIDTALAINRILQKMDSNYIDFRTFSAKMNVDYRGGDGKSYNVNAVIRMYKDSAIWISVNAILGIEAMRVLITKDSVKLLNKLNKTYSARTVGYLQEVTALPLDLETVQDLIIGNPVYVNPNIISYSEGNNIVSMLSVGEWFKNLITLSQGDYTLIHSKLDDADITRNRTADLTYNDYENKKGFPFSTKRRITIAEKNRLDIRLEFKQYDFDQEVSFPFSVSRNYDRN